MDGFLTWMVYGAGALLAGAAVVAWWEHLARTGRRGPAGFDSPLPRALSLDIDLATLEPEPDEDSHRRQQVLEGALLRMAQADAGHLPRPGGWIETRPMVGPGAPVEPARSQAA